MAAPRRRRAPAVDAEPAVAVVTVVTARRPDGRRRSFADQDPDAEASPEVKAFFARMVRHHDGTVTDLPPARTTLAGGFRLDVWCKACQRTVDRDLGRLIDEGHGDVALTELPWRCGCGSRQCGTIVTARRVGPRT